MGDSETRRAVFYGHSANAVPRCPNCSPIISDALPTGENLDGDFLDKGADGRSGLASRFEIESDRFPDVLPGIVQRIAFGDATWQRWNVGRVTAFFRWLKNDS
jgi:hypothetical protein